MLQTLRDEISFLIQQKRASHALENFLVETESSSRSPDSPTADVEQPQAKKQKSDGSGSIFSCGIQ